MRLQLHNFREYIKMHNFLEENEIRTQPKLEEEIGETVLRDLAKEENNK